MRSVLTVDAKTIGKRIAAARKIADLTRPQLAERLDLPGLGEKTIGNIERGTRELRAHEYAPLAEALEVPVDFLRPVVAPPADSIDQRLDKIEQGMAERTAEVKQLLETQNALLARQSAILEKIEAAVAQERAVRHEAQEAQQGLLAAVAAANRALEAGPRHGAAKGPPRST